MRFLRHLVGLFCVTLVPLELGATESHRVLVVSATRDRAGGGPCGLRVVEVESGGVLASVEVGSTADAALTREGDLVAVKSHYIVSGVSERQRRLEIFRTSDLSLVQRGFVPVRTNTYKEVPSSVKSQFSADGTELVVQGSESQGSNNNARNRQAVLTRLQRELDDAGMFKIAGQPFKVPDAPFVVFLSIAQWPRIAVWNYHGSSIEVLDVHANSIRSVLRLQADTPGAFVVTSDGKHAYYVPQHSPQAAGYLRRIDLTTDPPKVIRTSEERHPYLRARVAAVSETAGAIFVGEDKIDPEGMRLLPSPSVKTFHTLTLAPAGDIELSLTDCDCLAASQDGKYLYALDRAGGMSVVEIATRKEAKVLRDVGAHPGMVFALP
jgi:hypothetical protein